MKTEETPKKLLKELEDDEFYNLANEFLRLTLDENIDSDKAFDNFIEDNENDTLQNPYERKKKNKKK